MVRSPSCPANTHQLAVAADVLPVLGASLTPELETSISAGVQMTPCKLQWSGMFSDKINLLPEAKEIELPL